MDQNKEVFQAGEILFLVISGKPTTPLFAGLAMKQVLVCFFAILFEVC
jgi:hypothetical protein